MRDFKKKYNSKDAYRDCLDTKKSILIQLSQLPLSQVITEPKDWKQRYYRAKITLLKRLKTLQSENNAIKDRRHPNVAN